MRDGALDGRNLRGTIRDHLVIVLSLSDGPLATGIILSCQVGRQQLLAVSSLNHRMMLLVTRAKIHEAEPASGLQVCFNTTPAQRIWQSRTDGEEIGPGLAHAHTSYKLCPGSDIITARFVAGGKDAQVGLVHNYMNYEPYTNTWAAKWYLQPVCNTMQYIWGTAVILKYLQTGKFLWQAPVGSKVEFDEGSKPGLDFIGMNYYGRYC